MFIPLQVIAFATLAPQFRTNGTALLSLFRNVGSAIGVSVTETLLTRNTQIEHSVLAGYVTPFNRALQGSQAVMRARSGRRPRTAPRRSSRSSNARPRSSPIITISAS